MNDVQNPPYPIHEQCSHKGDTILSTFKTLLVGASTRADDKLRDVYAIELIDQKIRETETQVHVAKSTLASLIQRHRSEQKLLDMLQNRIATI